MNFRRRFEKTFRAYRREDKNVLSSVCLLFHGYLKAFTAFCIPLYYFPYVRLVLAPGRSPAEIVGSNPTGGMDICLL